jgi:hypothetical protein
MTPARRLVLALLSCSCAGATDQPPFDPVADVKQLMVSVLEPAAEAYWDAVGSVVDERGTVEFAPGSPEEWDAVRNSAYVIAESGNLLMMGARARDRGDWITLSLAMVEAGRRALAAAQARDTSGVFEAGGVLYDTCTACHAKYAVATLRPSGAAQ